MKGLTSQQLEELGCHVILGNTYHLESRPGSQLVAALGGLHGFVGWPRGMLTDSGGFQVTSPDFGNSNGLGRRVCLSISKCAHLESTPNIPSTHPQWYWLLKEIWDPHEKQSDTTEPRGRPPCRACGAPGLRRWCPCCTWRKSRSRACASSRLWTGRP